MSSIFVWDLNSLNKSFIEIQQEARQRIIIDPMILDWWVDDGMGGLPIELHELIYINY